MTARPFHTRLLALLLTLALGLPAFSARLQGQVFDILSGQPLHNARVDTQPAYPPVFSNGAGQFVLEGLESGPLFLSVTREGYHPTELLMDLQPGENSVTIGMEPQNTFPEVVELHGRATNGEGQGVANVRVVGPDGPTDMLVFTDEAGYWSYPAFVGVGSFHAYHPLYQTHENPAVTVGPQDTEYDFVLVRNDAPAARLVGMVSGAPDSLVLPGAQLTLHQGEFPPRNTVCGPDGHYEFNGILAGVVCHLNAFFPGYLPRSVEFTPGQGLNTRNLLLENPGGGDLARLSGIVRNANNDQPVQGAAFHFLLQPDHPVVLSSGNGVYLAENLLPGICHFRVEREGFHSLEMLVDLEPSQQLVLDLEMVPLGGGGELASLGGTVFVDGSDTVVAGARIELDTNQGVHRETFSTENGHYQFNELPTGTVVLHAHAEGFLPWEQAVTLGAGENTRHIGLHDGGDHDAFLSGRVSDALSGAPVPGALIHLPGPQHGQVLLTDEDGNYSTDHGHPLFSGPTDLHADAPGYFPFDLEFFLETGDNVLDFSMEPFEGNGQAASLSGTVSDAGSGMPLAHVCLSAPGFMGQPVTAESDSLGHFLLEGLHGGSSELMAAALGYHTLFMPLLLQPGDNSLDLFLNARDDGEPHEPVILGRVLDMFSHDPIGDAELLLQAGDQQWLGLSDEDGHFAFGPLAVDAPFATLSANADGYSEAQLELNLHGMGHHAPDTLRVNIEMMSLDNGMLLGLLAGNVRTEDTGLPVYAMVEAISAEPGDPLSFHTFTNSSGHWSLDLPAGAWFVRCHVLSGGNGAPVDYTEYWEDAQSLDAATVIDLAPTMVRDGMNFGIPRVDGGQITIQLAGRVSDADLQGIPGVALRFWTPAGELEEARVNTDPQGNWGATIILDRLPIVPFSISAEREGYLMDFFSNAESFADATQFSFTSDASISNLNFNLTAAADAQNSISGRLLDQSGEARADGLVVALDADTGALCTVPTDLQGNYRVGNDGDHRLTLLYFAPGHMPVFSGESWSLDGAMSYSGSTDMTNQDMSVRSLATSAGASTVTGLVRSEAGLPLAGALLLAVSTDGQDVRWALSGPQGAYSLAGLVDQNSYVVYCSLAGYHSGQSQVQADESDAYTRLLNFDLSLRGSTDLDDEPGLPAELALWANWPNPFNPVTSLSYELERQHQVRLQVFNLRGALVATLVDGVQPAGNYTLDFDGNGLASGVYIYRLQADGRSLSRKMVLLK